MRAHEWSLDVCACMHELLLEAWKKVADLIDGDAGGDGGVHRAQRALAAGRLGLDVRARRRRRRAPPPVGHALIDRSSPAADRFTVSDQLPVAAAVICLPVD